MSGNDGCLLEIKNGEAGDGRWTRIPVDGTKRTGMTRACNGIKRREQGAPVELIRKVPICTPVEIGK